MDSLWTKTVTMPHFPALARDCSTDVLIIGGGMAGLLCAHSLHAAGVDCILVEAKRICSGVTGGTTAKITAQHGLIYDKLARRFGMETAGAYLRANLTAVERYRDLCRDMDCDFAERDSYVYSLDGREKIDREIETLRTLAFPAEFSRAEALPFSVCGAVRFPRQAQFHPLKFAAAIARDLPVFENTKVLAYTPEKIVTNHAVIRAKRIIVTTHFPIFNKHGLYFIKQYQSRSYVLALRGAADVGGMYLDESGKGLSLRNHGDLLLVGCGSHRTGKRGSAWRVGEDFARRCYPGAKIVGRWAAQDCMSLDGMPYIGPYSPATPNLFVATGFNKWGMSTSMLAAMILTDLVLDRKSPYAGLFDPARSILHPQLALNALESAISLLTPTRPRCPHLGCALKYNVAERSWDCPCHGSRFDENGKLLDGPATDDKDM